RGRFCRRRTAARGGSRARSYRSTSSARVEAGRTAPRRPPSTKRGRPQNGRAAPGSTPPYEVPVHLALAIAGAAQHDLQGAARAGEIGAVEAVLEGQLRPLGRQ